MNLRNWFSARGLCLYSQVVRRTGRYQLYGEERLDVLDAAGCPAIWTSWHGSTMIVAGYVIRRLASAPFRMLFIVPDDWRGETLAEWGRLMGTRAFAVSMREDSLVAARRLLKLVQELKNGVSTYINPDGPDGPPSVPKPGISFLASRSGVAVLPLGVYTSARFQLRRWDRYTIPFPFSRITVVFGEPLTVGRKEDISAAGGRIAAAINQAMAEAEMRHNL